MEKCPYATKCVGYIGGSRCLNFEWIKCEEFKTCKEIDKTLVNIRKTIKVHEYELIDHSIRAASFLKKLDAIKKGKDL